VHAEELAPRAVGAFGLWIEPVLEENGADGRAADPVDAELSEFAEDAGVAPAGLSGDAKDDLADLGRAFAGGPASWACGPSAAAAESIY